MADYGTGPTVGTASPYDVLRKRAEQRVTAGGQEAVEAMKRRYAAMGNLNSGSAIRSEQIQNNENQQQKEQAIGAIDLGEAQEGSQKNFAANESEKARSFTAGQAALERAQRGDQFGAQLELERQKQNYAQTSGDRQYELDKATTAFNSDLANFQKGHTGGFFGGGGFLGLGF